MGHFDYFLPTVKSNFIVGPQFMLTLHCLASHCSFSYQGLFLYLNHPSFSERNELTDFFKKRVLRIFPLYWLAIATVVGGGTMVVGGVVGGLQFASRVDAVVIVLGLQGFLSPRLSSDHDELVVVYWGDSGAVHDISADRCARVGYSKAPGSDRV